VVLDAAAGDLAATPPGDAAAVQRNHATVRRPDAVLPAALHDHARQAGPRAHVGHDNAVGSTVYDAAVLHHDHAARPHGDAAALAVEADGDALDADGRC